MNLVTLAEAKAHLYIDDDAHDAWLTVFIAAASQAIELWVRDADRLYIKEMDSNGDMVPSTNPHPIVKASVLLELSSHFRFREGESTDNSTPTGDLYSGRYGYVLNKTSTALLMPLRKPVVS